MNRIYLYRFIVVLLVSGGMLSACNNAQIPAPPENTEIGNAIGELYRRSGLNGEINGQEIVGKHYQPAHQRWDVLACVDFVVPSGDSGRDCNDSFELYHLDTGKWIVSGTISGGHLWLEVLEN